MKPRYLRSKPIPTQYIEDVFDEFYRLDSIINDGNEYQKNYVITRLVTIIEQFFRIIVEDRLHARQGKTPEPITLDPAIIDEITAIHAKGEREITRELVVSINYKFQSGDQIKKTMKDYGLKIFQDNVKKTDYDELFDLRHMIIHSFAQPPSKIRKYYELTEKLFRHVLGLINIKHPSFYLLKIEALAHIDYEKAVECFKEYEQHFNEPPGKSPKNALTYYDRAMALHYLGEYEKAVSDFDRVIDLTRNDHTLYSYIGMRLCKSKKDGDRLQVLAEYDKGIALLEIHDYDAAIKCFERILKTDPGDIDTHVAKGKSLLKLGNVAEARKCLCNSIWISDLIDAQTYYEIAKLLLGMDDIDESAKCFTKALTIFNDEADSDDVVANYGKGVLLQDLGDNSAAIECFDKSIKANPNNADVYVAKGQSLLHLENYVDAQNCFVLATKIRPNNMYAHFGAGMSAQKIGESGIALAYTDNILALCDVVLKTEPNDAMAYHYKGMALQWLSKHDTAMNCFDKAIELDPNYADAYRSKGELSQYLDEHEDTKECFSTVAKLDKRRRRVKKMVDSLMGVGGD